MYFEELSSQKALEQSLALRQQTKKIAVVGLEDSRLLQALTGFQENLELTLIRPFKPDRPDRRERPLLTNACDSFFDSIDDFETATQSERFDTVVIDCSENGLAGTKHAGRFFEYLPPGGLLVLWCVGTSLEAILGAQISYGSVVRGLVELSHSMVSRGEHSYSADGTFFFHKPSLNLERFKGAHSGERVWIIGNGPSLNDIDFNLLRGETTIAMNRISLLYDRTDWRPSYYLYFSDNVTNSKWGKDWSASVRQSVANESTMSFVWSRYADILDPNSTFTPVDSVSEMAIGTSGSFSQNIDQHVSKTGTSVNIAYQFASWFGARAIFLVGTDLGWATGGGSGEDSNHFHSEYRSNIPNGEKENRRMRETHKTAKLHLERDGIKTFNASTRTLLDIFPLVDFFTIARKKDWFPQHEEDEDTVLMRKRRAEITEYWGFPGLGKP